MSAGDACAVARYTPDGALDPSFGSGGLVTTDLGTVGIFNVDCDIDDIAIADDGGLVAVGRWAAEENDFLLIRYLPNGSLDSSFGSGGIVHSDVTGMLMNDAAYAVALDEAQRIVTVGDTTLDAQASFAVARYMVPEPSGPSLSIALTALAALGRARARPHRRAIRLATSSKRIS